MPSSQAADLQIKRKEAFPSSAAGLGSREVQIYPLLFPIQHFLLPDPVVRDSTPLFSIGRIPSLQVIVGFDSRGVPFKPTFVP